MSQSVWPLAKVSAARLSRGLWWEKPWTLVNGCSPVSEGCVRCWSARAAEMRLKDLVKDGSFTGKVRVMRDRLLVPARRRVPTVYALWNDLFHQAVPQTFISDAMIVMCGAERHTYIVLTKRAGRMLSAVEEFLRNDGRDNLPSSIWLGVTAENQARADERLPVLANTPGAVRVVSVEPMLGPMDLTPYLQGPRRLDWVLCGGESGPGARPMHPDWPRRLRDQCRAAGVAFFFKQWGEWSPDEIASIPGQRTRTVLAVRINGAGDKVKQSADDGQWMQRMGKAAAGHALDGETCMEFPKRRPAEGD